MMRRHTLAALPIALLALTLGLTGCGAEDDGSQVASGSQSSGQSSGQAGSGTGEATSAPPSLSQDELGVKFAQCLRENGLDVADPEPGKGIRLKLDGSDPTKKAAIDKAMEACRQYNPQGQSSAGADPKLDERNREFAACMRKNGVESFPDPKPGQRGILVDKRTGEDPDFEKAQQACQSVLSGGR